MPKGKSAMKDAPTPRDFRSLLRTARNDVKEKYRLECEFILRVIGELGLRPGELAHLKESWVDFDEQEIAIPEQESCTKGRDNGPCGYCKKRAKSIAKHHDDISYEKAVVSRWQPKSGPRGVWFGWDDELFDLLDEYLSLNGEYQHSRVSVNRRISRVARVNARLDEEDVYPAALRAHAALLHARKGVRAPHLMEYMGWSKVDPAVECIRMTSGDTKSEFQRAHRTPINQV
jgi:integrase